MMEEIESERDVHKDKCAHLEAQLEISQKIVSTQEEALAAKEVQKLNYELKFTGMLVASSSCIVLHCVMPVTC